MAYGSGKYSYELLDIWAKYPYDWSLHDVCGLSVDSQDRVYVLNRGDHPIIVFDREGNLLTSWGEGYFSRAHGTCTGPDDSVYCTDDVHHIVSKFNRNGKLLLVLGNKDQPSDTGYVKKPSVFHSLETIVRGGPPFNRPTGVALSPSGEIYVTDGYGNARVHKFSSDGTLLFSWGEPGYALGQFMLPHSVRVDKKGHVWVVDRENSRIQIFDAQGEFLNQWTDLCRPTDLCIDDKEIVHVSELSPPRVSIFTINGKLLARWGNEGERSKEEVLFFDPHDIAVDSHGDIYVGDVALSGHGVERGPKVIRKFIRKANA